MGDVLRSRWHINPGLYCGRPYHLCFFAPGNKSIPHKVNARHLSGHGDAHCYRDSSLVHLRALPALAAYCPSQFDQLYLDVHAVTIENKIQVSALHTTSSSISLALLRVTALLFFIVLCGVSVSVGAAPQIITMEDRAASVRFDAAQEAAAKEVLRLYPTVRSDLGRLIPWPVDFSPTFVLLKEGALEEMAETRLVAAVAIPERDLVLLDVSKMSRHALVLETTMKHELCHLLLHHYIRKSALPKWLDEGVCQWVSNGMAEIIMDRKVSFLNEAVLAGRLLSLQQLSECFPSDDRSLLLAYEQSQSIVTYMSQKYGTEKLLLILNRLRDGKTLQEAVAESLGIAIPELEGNWQRSLKKEWTFLLFVSIHLYEILFFVAALLTVAGVVRLIRRRKGRLKRDEEEPDEE
jgi:hypothetical protein